MGRRLAPALIAVIALVL